MEGGMGTIIFLVLILASFLFYPLVLPLSKRMGKKPLVIAAVAVCVVGYAIIFFYEPIGALLGTAPVEPGGFWAGLAGEGVQSGYVILLLIIGVLFGFPITAGNLLNNGICTDIIQYHAIRKGRTYSGIFAAAQNVIFSIPSTLVPAMTGLLIYLGTTNDMPTVFGVQSTAILAVVLVVPAIFFYRLYNEREVLSVIRGAVAESGAATAAIGVADKDGGSAS
jgi:Na+/melibiose symporter-like transporter